MNSRRPARSQAPVQFQAYCDRCRRRFVDDRALEQHTRASPRHNVCDGCDFDYITHEEMEECDCNGSEEEEEASDEYGSAGTLSDDGGGGRETAHYGSVFAGGFNTYYSVPGAWAGGTSASVSESSFPSVDPHDAYLDPEVYGGPEDYSPYYSESDGSSDHSEDVTEDEDEDPERDGGQSPVPNAQPTPYCQRCNREFNTVNGLHLHHRMSRLHPWYCSECRVDFDREGDLQRHVAAVHSDASQPAGRQPSTSEVADTSSRTVINMLGQLNNQMRSILDRTAVPDADTSNSTIRNSFGIIPVPEPQQARDLNESRPPQSEAASVTRAEASGAKPQLVVSCPLCLEDAVALTTTLCGHVFCKECITAAIQHKSECPVCRAFTHIKSLHPIFLNVITS